MTETAGGKGEAHDATAKGEEYDPQKNPERPAAIPDHYLWDPDHENANGTVGMWYEPEEPPTKKR